MLRIFFDHVDLVCTSDIVTRYHPSDAALADRVATAATALVLYYGNSMSTLPSDFREGMGDTFFGIAGLSLGYLENLNAVAQSLGVALPGDLMSLLDLLPAFFLENDMNQKNREFMQRMMANFGAANPVEFLLLMLEKMGIPQQTSTALLDQSEALTHTWYNNLVAMMDAQD